MRGIINIVIGLVFIVGGLSGGMVLRGTNSGMGLAVLGVVLTGWGIFRFVKQG
ncbi:MAG: hypothetical protein ABSG53_10060 [Thermoguttaceae bacterium]|jgi:hypothetical protein